MFSIDNFIEIQVVGFLLLLAISPLVNLLTPALRVQEGFCPFFENIPDKSAKAILLLVLAFSVGIAGNRLVDELFDGFEIEGREEFETKCSKKELCKKDEGCQKYVECLQKKANSTKEFDIWAKANSAKLQKIKLAEYYVSDHSDTAQKYFERHKSFMRVLRGAAFASLFLLFSMFIYRFAQRFRKLSPLCHRYSVAHLLVVFMFFLIFYFAYVCEAQHYYNRVVEMYTKDYFEQVKPFIDRK